jgi:hypothetical protein
MSKKICITCDIEKHIDDFSNDKSRKDGKRPECKTCKSERDKKYRIENSEKKKKIDKEYYEKHKDERKEYSKKWYSDNIDHNKEVRKEWYNNNQDIVKKSRQKFLDKIGKDAVKKYNNDYHKDKYKNDLQYRIKALSSARIRNLIKKNGRRTIEMIGCSIQELKKWLEYQFNEDMTWENQGKYWHIDHVTPCASFDLTNEEELKKCFSWENLRPCIGIENIEKKDKIIPKLIEDHKKICEKYKNNL